MNVSTSEPGEAEPEIEEEELDESFNNDQVESDEEEEEEQAFIPPQDPRSDSPKPDASTEKELERLRKKWDQEIKERKLELKNGKGKGKDGEAASPSSSSSKKWWYADNRDDPNQQDDGEEKVETTDSSTKGKETQNSSSKEVEDENSSLPQPSISATEYYPTSTFPSTSRLPPSISAYGTDWRSQISSSALPFSTSSAIATSSHPQAAKSKVDGENSGTEVSKVAVPTKGNIGTKNNIRNAVKIYAKAVEDERKGRLDDALTGYRKAFRLNSSADKLYERAVSLFTAFETGEELDVPGFNSTPRQWGGDDDDVLGTQEVRDQIGAAMEGDDYRYVKMRAREEKEKTNSPVLQDTKPQSNLPPQETKESTTTSKSQEQNDQDELTLLLTRLNLESEEPRDFSKIKFEPEDEEQPLLLNNFPDEVLLLILANLVAPRGRRGAKVAKNVNNQPAVGTSTQVSTTSATAEEPATSTSTQDPALTVAPKSRPKIPGIGVVLAGPDWQSLENAARTCWKLRLASRDPDLWRMIVHETYFPPQLKVPEPPQPVEEETQNVEGQDGEVEDSVVEEATPLAQVEEVASIQERAIVFQSSKSNSKAEMSADVLSTILPTLLASLYSRHSNSWRSVFINEPRLRLNGSYISSCHYTRSGMSEESIWINVIHVVEFYRSLRFLPDGKVFSFLTTDLPTDTVKRMEESSLKGVKGFCIGRWELRPQGLDQEGLDDFLGGIDYSNLNTRENGLETVRKINSLRSSPSLLIWDLKDETLRKYTFRMLFSLRQTSKGKWNKLEMVEYASRNEITGETIPIPQKHSRPFIFSRVVAYGV